MNEINRAAGSVNLTDISAQQRVGRAKTRPDAAANRGLERSGDSVELRPEGVALSKLGNVEDIRSDLVTRLSAEVNDPDYDIDAKLALAFDKMFG